MLYNEYLKEENGGGTKHENPCTRKEEVVLFFMIGMTASAREMGVLSTKIEMFEKKVDNLETKIDANHNQVIGLFEKFRNEFASKKSVDRLRFIVWSIVGFVFTVVGTLVFKIILL